MAFKIRHSKLAFRILSNDAGRNLKSWSVLSKFDLDIFHFCLTLVYNIIELDLLLTVTLMVHNLNNYYRYLFICGDPVELLASLLLPPWSFIGDYKHSNEGYVYVCVEMNSFC